VELGLWFAMVCAGHSRDLLVPLARLMALNPYSLVILLAHRVLAFGARVPPEYQCVPVKPFFKMARYRPFL
jgi:hypothetical protein